MAAGWYQDELKFLIHEFKYHQSLYLTTSLATLLRKRVQNYYQHCPLPSAIIPMPLHRKRTQQRGYNQALELSKCLSKQLNITLLNRSCQRALNTPSQSALSFKQRQSNVNKAFTAQAIAHSHVAILDDVVTSGASANALANALKQQTSSLRVDVWCLAKTPPPNQ